jgi:gliding motility-associated-like protein
MKYLNSLLKYFLIVTVFFGVNELKATHSMGADLTYKCIGNNKYEITLRFYRDCAGVSAPSSATVTATSSCTTTPISVQLIRDPIFSALEVTPLCPALRQCSFCNPAPPPACPSPLYPGVEVYTYVGIVTLPSACADWNLSWTTCCRNNAITNLQNPGSQSMYINILINNTNNICNTSPYFSELPTPYICNNQLYNYNHGVIEPDGDSIVYSLITPMTTGGTAIGFNPGYTVTNPLSTLNGLSFNQSSGQLGMIPNMVQQAVTVVRVSEYRNGVLIGQIIRDIQVVVIDCPTNQIVPVLSGVRNPGGGGYIIDSLTLGVCPNNTITFDIVGTDGNSGDSVFISSNFTTVFPSGTFSTSGNNPTTASFSWTPGTADTGKHFFIVTVKDDNCPVFSTQTHAYVITVLNDTKAGPDRKYCFEGGPIRLQAVGGSIFHWRPTQPIVDAAADSSWILVAPTQNTMFTVFSDCNRIDSTYVEVVQGFPHTISPNDTICKFEESPLWVNPDPTHAPFDITWTPEYKIDTNKGSAITAQPLVSTNYTVQMISALGCIVYDSINVNIKGEKPRVAINPDKNYLCRDPNDQVQISMLAAPTECGPSTTGGCNGNTIDINVGQELFKTSSPTPYYGIYKFSRMQMLYRKEDLNGVGFFGGNISKVGFYIAQKLTTSPFSDFKIWMGCVDMDELGDDFEENLTLVYSGTNVVTANGLNEYTLNTSYDWDGFTDIIVQVCISNPNNTSLNDFISYTPTSYNSVLLRASDNIGPGCDLILPFIKNNARPNLLLGVCGKSLSGFGIQWAPTSGVSNPNIENPIISGIPVTTGYIVEIDNNGCKSYPEVTIFVDSTFIDITDDTLLCNADPIQLYANPIGLPPDQILTCGANNTPITGTNVTYPVSSGIEEFKGTMFQGNNYDMRYQILLLATDLKAAGIKTGVITEINFELATKNSTKPAENYTVSMGCTSASDLSKTAFEPSPDIVYATPAFNSVLGWNNIKLDNPFDWDGQANIVLNFCWQNAGNVMIGGTDNFKARKTNYQATSREYSQGIAACNYPSPRTTYNMLPNVTLGMVPPPPGIFEYLWTQTKGDNGLSDSSSQTPTINPTVNSTYVVRIESKLGCFIYDTVNIDVNIVTTSVSQDTAVCFGETATLEASGGDFYSWQPRVNTKLSNPDSTFTFTTPDATTTFTVTISDNAGCINEEYTTVTVDPIPLIDAGPSETILIGLSTTLQGIGGTIFNWKPDINMTGANTATPTVSPVQTTTYTLTSTDDNGCTDFDTVTIKVNSVDDVYIPTAFTPNGDGINDIYFLVAVGLTDIQEFKIFNRWGEIVFDGTSFNDGWDGTKKGQKQPIGTYSYILIATDYKGETIIKKGNITLIR